MKGCMNVWEDLKKGLIRILTWYDRLNPLAWMDTFVIYVKSRKRKSEKSNVQLCLNTMIFSHVVVYLVSLFPDQLACSEQKPPFSNANGAVVVEPFFGT